MNLQDETWKAIAGFENAYDVSDRGRVRRSPNARPCRGHLPGKILTADASTGYARVSLTAGGHSCKRLIHRLVAFEFLSDGGVDRQHVNHIDGNKLNNDVSNLEWVTHRENRFARMAHRT